MFLIVEIEQPVLEDLDSKKLFPSAARELVEISKNGSSKYSKIKCSAGFDPVSFLQEKNIYSWRSCPIGQSCLFACESSFLSF